MALGGRVGSLIVIQQYVVVPIIRKDRFCCEVQLAGDAPFAAVAGRSLIASSSCRRGPQLSVGPSPRPPSHAACRAALSESAAVSPARHPPFVPVDLTIA
jgi:hypothetical protein